MQVITDAHLERAKELLVGRCQVSADGDHWISTDANAQISVYRERQHLQFTAAMWLYAIERHLNNKSNDVVIRRMCTALHCINPCHQVLTSRSWSRFNVDGDWTYLASVVKNHTSEQDNGCLLWTGHVSSIGVTIFNNMSVHRLVYFLNHGRIKTLPDGHCISRSCGTPTCVASDHLLLVPTNRHVVDEVTEDFCVAARSFIIDRVCYVDDHWIATTKLGNGPYPRANFRERKWKLNRLSWIAFHSKPVPQGQIIRHICKEKTCINPAHLETGTHSDNNNADRVRDGTVCRGKRCHRTTIDEETARAIKQSKGEMTQKARAAKFGVTHRIVRGIDNGTSWSWVE